MLYQDLKSQIQQKYESEYKRGQIIYHEGDSPKELYFIESGLVGLFHIAETGKETFLRVFGVNAIFGHRSYFANEIYHASAIALAPTKLTVISTAECDRICREDVNLLREVTAILASELGKAELRLAGLQDKPANMRIVEALIYLKNKYPEQTWTRKEVAEFAGSTLETVTRVMTLLEQEQLIEKSGRDFTIIDCDKLLSFDFN